MFDLTDKSVYLSGPMSGLPDFNRGAFAAARELCERLGADEVFDPTRAWGHSNKHHTWYMRHDLHRLTQSEGNAPHFDAIVMLDGYEDSEGALTEMSVAIACGIAVVGIWELRKAAQGQATQKGGKA